MLHNPDIYRILFVKCTGVEELRYHQSKTHRCYSQSFWLYSLCSQQIQAQLLEHNRVSRRPACLQLFTVTAPPTNRAAWVIKTYHQQNMAAQPYRVKIQHQRL